MSVRLPLIPSEPFYSFATTLAEVEYLIDVRWNTRAASWSFDVSSVDGDMIRSGMPLLLGSSLAALRSANTAMPAGVFVVQDTSGEDTDAAFDDLGVRVVCDFYTFAEWAAF